MRLVKIVRLRLRSLFRSRRVERELAEELRNHLHHQIEVHVAAGMTRASAREAAHREFGNVALVQEHCRDTRGIAWLEDLLRDTAYGWRSMRRAPGHAAVAALSLAVGIGANTATFSLVNTLLLRPLPVADPQELVELGSETSSGPGNFSYPSSARRSRSDAHRLEPAYLSRSSAYCRGSFRVSPSAAPTISICRSRMNREPVPQAC